MTRSRTDEASLRNGSAKSTMDIRGLSIEILNFANQAIPWLDFLREISRALIAYLDCDSFEILINEKNSLARVSSDRKNPESVKYDTAGVEDGDGEKIPDNSLVDFISGSVIRGEFDRTLPCFDEFGSFWTNDMDKTSGLFGGEPDKNVFETGSRDYVFKSQAIIPVRANGKNLGGICIFCIKPNCFSQELIKQYEEIARILGIAFVNHQAQLALRERIKELTCAYRIAQVADEPGKSLPEIIEYIITLLPSAWMYPDIAASRIIIDGKSYATSNFRGSRYKLSSYIVINGVIRGAVEVYYLEKKPEMDEGPFLSEERKLIDNIAKQVALIIEKKEAEMENIQLQNQIRHADRLATIGQLAAGVAHELNEPLGNILGFAQLLQKDESLPGHSVRDIDKIVSASLHAREIIKKLMLFARQMPSQKDIVNLNKVIEEGLYFFEARCASAQIKVDKILSPDLPDIIGDYTQLNQLLINLVVNSIQAMPDGGSLTIKTFADKSCINLTVEDTGVGMSEDVLKKIFIPFFTTKDVNEGTGLGLAVVHGIVSLHRGSIDVKSEPNKGSVFKIKLPVAQSGYVGE